MTTVVLNTVTRKVEVFSSARDVLARAEIADHKAAANPHPQYLADADLAEVALSGDAGDLTAGTVPDARMPNWAGYSVATRTALQAANVPAAVASLSLLGHAAVGDGGGAHYKRVASEPAHPNKIQSADGAWWEELFAVDISVSIPSDFATLQEAIDRLSKQPVRRGARIIVNIASGHALTGGLSLENGDFGRFTIMSTDAEVALDAAFPTTDAVLRAVNARAPVWSILVNCNDQIVGSSNEVPAAIFLRDCSSLTMMPGCGAKNSGGYGIFVGYNSKVFAVQPVFSGCSEHAVWVTGSSDAMLNDGDFTNCTSATSTAYVSRASRLSAVGSNFSNATGRGLLVRRSYAMVTSSLASTLFANCGGVAIEAAQGSTVVANERNSLPVVISNCNAGVLADEGSTVDFHEGQISNVTTYAFLASLASHIVAYRATCTGVGGDVIVARRGSTVDAFEMTATGAAGQGILASGGSVVNATGANVSGASGGDDVEVSEGGIVAFASGTGTVNQAVNSPTGAGIIFNPAITKKGTWTPVVSFSTLGNLSVTYVRQYGVWWREGDLIWFAFEVAWTHTHSTSSGPLQISGLPVHPATFSTVIHPGINFSRISRVVFGASDKQLLAEVIPATNRISLQVARDGTTVGSASTTHFPSSGGEFLLGGHGSYRTA